MRDLGLPLSADAAARIVNMQDNCSLLLLFDFINNNRVQGSVPNMTGVVARAEDVSAWRSEDWLLGYECGRLGWASDAAFRAQPHWAELLRMGVSFFNVAPVSSSPEILPVAVPSAVSESVPDATTASVSAPASLAADSGSYEDGTVDGEAEPEEGNAENEVAIPTVDDQSNENEDGDEFDGEEESDEEEGVWYE